MKDENTYSTFKLVSYIEMVNDIRQVPETRILNNKVDFTLKKVQGVANKEFCDKILNVIRKTK